MGSALQKELKCLTGENVKGYRERFPTSTIWNANKKSLPDKDSKVLIQLSQFFKEYERMKSIGNPVVIYKNKKIKGQDRVQNNYPILTKFRQFPIIQETNELIERDIKKIIQCSEDLKGRKEILFCIKEMKYNNYHRIFLNAFQYFHIGILSYETVSQIPYAYLKEKDMVIGIGQLKELRKRLKGEVKQKGNIYLFCRKEEKQEIENGSHIRYNELRKEVSKMTYSLCLSTNILQIIQKISTIRQNPYRKKYQKTYQVGRQRITNICVCTQQKSKENYITFTYIKKLQKTFPFLKVNKLSMASTDIQSSSTKCKPIHEIISEGKYCLLVIGESIKQLMCICDQLQKHCIEDKVVILRKDCSNEQLVDKIVHIFESNELPEIVKQIPQLIVYGSDEYYFKLLKQLPLFDIKRHIKTSQINQIRHLSNEIVICGSDSLQYLEQENDTILIKQYSNGFCENQLLVNILQTNNVYRMRYNYCIRKLSAISDYMYGNFSELRMKNRVLQYNNTNVLLFKCDKQLQLDISQKIVPFLIPKYSKHLHTPQGIFRIKQKILQQLLYLKQLKQLPQYIFMNIAKQHHECIQDICKQLIKYMIQCEYFRSTINRIFTQILFQNKREYVQYIPYILFTILFGFTKTASFHLYTQQKFKIRIQNVDLVNNLHARYMKKESQAPDAVGQFLLGKIIHQQEDEQADTQSGQKQFIIQTKNQYINDYSHFHTFYIIGQYVLIPPLTKLQKQSSKNMHFSMNYAKEHYFLGYFAKLIFTQQFLQSSQNTVYSLHECLSLFRKKMYLTLNGKLRKLENKFTFYYENSLRVMNLISQGLLREAQLVLDYENPYYFAFFEYVERERDKIEKGLKKNKPMNKKKRKYHWNVEIDSNEQNFRVKNMDKGYEYQLRQGKLNLGIKGLQFYGKGFSSSSQILSNLVSRIFKQEQYTQNIITKSTFRAPETKMSKIVVLDEDNEEIQLYSTLQSNLQEEQEQTKKKVNFTIMKEREDRLKPLFKLKQSNIRQKVSRFK